MTRIDGSDEPRPAPTSEDLESVEATSELIADQAAQTRVRQAEGEVARGEVLDERDVRSLLAQQHRPGMT